jgi:hypothetical protein
VSSWPTNLFSLLPKVILTAPHLRFQQRFFSPGWVFAFPHLSGANPKPTFPQLNLHNTASAATPSGFLQVAVSKAPNTVLVRASPPARASDTALRQLSALCWRY